MNGVQHCNLQQKSVIDMMSNDSDHSDQEQSQTLKQHSDKIQQKISIAFGKDPVPMKCPFCLQHIKSQIIAKPQLISVVLGFFLFCLLPNAIMIIVLILVVHFTSTQKHRCPLCERELGTDGKFLRIFDDQVYSFSFQDSGILISKKIIFSGLIFVCIIGILYIRATYFPNLPEFTQMTWPQLQKVCPKNTISIQCKNEVEGKTVKNWKGFIMKAEDQRQNFRKYYQHAVRLYVKMDPQENSDQFPDIILSADSGYAYYMTQVLDDLSHGDQIRFNGTFSFSKTQRNVDEKRHMELIGLQKTPHHNPKIYLYLTDEEKIFQERNKRKQNENSLRVDDEDEQKGQEKESVQQN